jgi:hypothetical protein
MPTKKKKSKKKPRDQNAKINTCEGCSVQLDKQKFHYCECTQVKFCSPECQAQHPHKDCPGPPDRKVDVREQLEKFRDKDKGWKEEYGRDNASDLFNRQSRENRETVQKPFMAYLLSKGRDAVMRGDQMTAWDLAELADEGDEPGHQAAAYMAGSRFKHRMLGVTRLKRESMVTDNVDFQNFPVLESQELAFKYFEKAAKLGHGLAMQSLGECFDEGIGCKDNRRRANQWLWRSTLHDSYGAIEMLDGKALLPLELRGQSDMIDQACPHVVPGQSMCLGGPNLGSLLLIYADIAERENYTLPPFAGTCATATVNNQPSKPGGSRIPIIGTKAIKEVLQKVKMLRARGNNVQFSYGRRGTSKAATAQTYGSASRSIDNQVFIAPPFSACDERVFSDDHWDHLLKELDYENQLLPFCVHSEKFGNDARLPFCFECEIEARERLEAVSNGSVVLSVDEDLPQRGQAAIFRGKDGNLKMETWKTYAGGEVECILAIIAASGFFPYVTPLFIAQDPNFYWPLIADHGCVRGALEFVAPHIDWDNKIGIVKENILEQCPVIPNCRPGKYLRKCGNSFCNNLEEYRKKDFQFCSGCQRRRYCCAECQNADWAIHKFECKASSKTKEVNPRIETDGDINPDELAMKHELRCQEGDDAIVFGLKSKSQYNGMVGIVGETLSNGRIRLTLRSETSNNILSIKASNFHCIGVFCRKRRKKSRVFECVHGLEICSHCYFDFSTINRLAKLKYSGQDITNRNAIDQVNNTYFSSLKDEEESQVVEFDSENIPFECFGMENHPKQSYILKALVQSDTTMSIHAEIAKVAFVTYGATKYRVLRAFSKLDVVAEML